MPGTPICAARSAIAHQLHHDDRHPFGSLSNRYRLSFNSRKLTVLSASFLLAGICIMAAVQGALARDMDDHNVAAHPHSAQPAPSQPATVQPAGAGGLIVSTANVAVDKGDTLDRLLAAQGVPADNRRAVLDALGDMLDPASLQAGSRLRLTFAPADGNGNATRLVQTVELMTGDTTSLMVHIDAARPVSDQDVTKALQARTGTPAGKASIWVANQRQGDHGSADQHAQAEQSLGRRSPGGQSPGQQSQGQQSQDQQVASLDPQEDGQFVVQHVTGLVGRNLRASLIAKGLPLTLADEIVLGFKTGSGSSSALHAAATFEVIYEGVQRSGKLDEPELRYAMLDDGGRLAASIAIRPTIRPRP